MRGDEEGKQRTGVGMRTRQEERVSTRADKGSGDGRWGGKGGSGGGGG